MKKKKEKTAASAVSNSPGVITPVLHIFLVIGQSVLETKFTSNRIGRGVLMIEKQQDTRFAENNICGCEQKMKN